VLRNKVIPLLFAVLLLTLAGCSFPSVKGNSTPKSSPSVNSLVSVKRATLTPVITLEGKVSSSATYQISASAAGIFEVTSSDGGTVMTQGGASIAISYQALDRDRTLLVPSGAPVVPGLPLAQATYSGYALVAPVAGGNLLKLRQVPDSAKAQINGSGKPFDCKLLDSRPSLNSDGTSFVGCIVPAGQDVVNGLTGIVALRFPTVANALVLPVEAVAGTIGSASVFLKSAKGIREQEITVGATDGISIVVTGGLSEGDRVAIPSPSLLSH
jgi:hypothetical protein